MKKFSLFNVLFLCLALMVASCGKEDNKGTCSDGIKNQDETGIDCGGVCGHALKVRRVLGFPIRSLPFWRVLQILSALPLRLI
jgi:hypothetical protein